VKAPNQLVPALQKAMEQDVPVIVDIETDPKRF